MICVLHVSNALRPVTTRCGNPDLSPSFGYQDRQSIIPRRGKFRTRPVVQVHIALAIRQLQTFIKETSRSRPPSSSRFDTKWDKLDLFRRQCTTTINRVLRGVAPSSGWVELPGRGGASDVKVVLNTNDSVFSTAENDKPT